MSWPYDTPGGINPNPGYGLGSDYGRPPGYDPKAALWSQIASALQQAGAGIATAPRGQAVGQGLLGVLAGTQAGQQNYESGLLSKYKWDQIRKDQQAQDAAKAYFQPLVGGSQSAGAAGPNPVPFNTAFDAAGVTGGPAGDSGADATANDPFADLPENVRAVARGYVEAGDYENARKTINDFRLKGPDKPVVLGEGGILVDPTTGKPIAENPKEFKPSITQRPVGPGIVEPGYWDQNMKWVPTGERVKTNEGPQTTSVITLLMPDGKLKGFPNTDIAGVTAALQAGAVEPQRNGMVVETSPDGTQTITVGGASPSGLTKPTQTAVQEALLSAGSKIATTNQIMQKFQPIYQQIGTKFDMAVAAGKDKLGIPLDPETQKALGDYSTFVASAGQNLSQVVKELAGSAVTPSEAKRILTYVPNAGAGIFDGDSPTVFRSKMDNFMKNLKMVQARLAYIQRNQNLSIENVPLESMPQIMQNRGDELQAIFEGKGLKGDDLKAAVTNQLAQEFGLIGQ